MVGDLAQLAPGQATLSLLTTEQGGILDDTVITKEGPDQYYIVTNAGCSVTDLLHLRRHLAAFRAQGGRDVGFEVLDSSLLALQGPAARSVVERVFQCSLADHPFMHRRPLRWGGLSLGVARCGYTGEDGFEIEVPHAQVAAFCDLLLSFPDVKLAGLGARDSLRLEAGLCLYGHDLTESTTPVAAGLAWTIGEGGGLLVREGWGGGDGRLTRAKAWRAPPWSLVSCPPLPMHSHLMQESGGGWRAASWEPG